MTDDSLTSFHTRRQFCARSLASAALGVLAPLCSGCSSPTSPSDATTLPTVNATQSGRVYSVTIDSSSPLSSVGSLALMQGPGVVLLIARTATSSFSALSSDCTHQLCTINRYSGSTFVCPCHGSQFDTSGRVVSGPAPAALAQFATSFANNVLQVTV